MSDLEWYLDVGGKQSGPHAAREIVEMVKAGKIPAASQVTAARMNGDWVTAQDLIDAYDELYKKPTPAVPISGGSPFTATISESDFAAPPRPTEQLEKSKIITLNREELEKAPDPTEALFHAIQAVREKANLKGGTSTTGIISTTRDSFGKLTEPRGTRIPPQLVLILVLASIFGLTIYGFTKIVAGKKSDETTAKKSAPSERRFDAPNETQPAEDSAGLLDDRGGGVSAARTRSPVQPRVQRGGPAQNTPTRSGQDGRDSGGARYRDDRDIEPEERDFDESDIEQNREMRETSPVDPSQVPADRLIPEPERMPERRQNPNEDTYQPPPIIERD